MFLSVLLHELGHSFVAMYEGIKVESITLFLLGGVARIEKECKTPMATLRVAAAGPLVSISLGIILLRLVGFISQIDPLLANLFSQLGLLNLVLAFFNLIPGLPLDGGVILKALVWKFTGSQDQGIKVANASGRIISLLSISLGILISIRGGGISGLWLIIIGWFGFSATRSQSQLLTFQKILIELKVNDASARQYRVLEEDQSLRRLSQMRMSSNKEPSVFDWVLVCSAGRWIGYITDKPLKELPVQFWDKNKVGDYVLPLSDLPSIGEKEPLWKAILKIEKTIEGRLLVFNLAGLPSGTLNRADIGEAVLKRLGMKIPLSFIEAARKQNIYPLGISLPQIVASMLNTGKINELD